MNQNILGTVLDGYKVLSERGSGSCGTVYQAENILSGQIFALKIFSARNTFARQELDALRLFRKISHPNLIRIHHVGQMDDLFFYTMDYCESSLAQRKVTPEELLPIARNLAGALAELHEHGLLHRDIKPDNIFFRNGEIVLGDIGLVTRKENAALAGSSGFLAPALLNGKISPCPYTDLYALAKSLYCALSGNEPEKFPCYDGTIGEKASLVMRAVLGVCSDEPSICTASELLHFLDGAETAIPPRKNIHFGLLSATIGMLLLLLAAGCLFLHRRFFRPVENPLPVKTALPEQPKKRQNGAESPKKEPSLPPSAAPEQPKKKPSLPSSAAPETAFLMDERGKLSDAAAKCADAEEKFELEYKGCMMDLLIALLLRKNSMTTARFREEQKKLVGISDFVKGLRTAGRAEEEKYILPEQKPLLAISDPERNRRWNERNAQWEKRKNACILNILREIKSTGKSPEEILKEKAKQDALLGFFGVELLNFVRRYREAEPGVAKETVLAEYLKRRNEFLNRNR